MKIQVVAKYYREEFLVPLFMQHYEPWADEITFLTRKSPDAKIDEEHFCAWMDEAIANSKADWLVLVDADEFVFPLPRGTDPRAVLAQADYEAVKCEMVRVWRHQDDLDIDRSQPPLPQRVHGEKDHIKTNVFKPGPGVRSQIGQHEIILPEGYRYGPSWSAVHWANADAAFWVERETVHRGPRLSEKNLANGWGFHVRRTPQEIAEQCARHLNDPVMIP